jgi:phage terminase small subunit
MAGNSNSGRKRLPATVHLLQGNRSKKSAAELVNEARPDVQIPDPPEHLKGDALAEWNRVAPLLQKMNIIAEQYMAPLAVYCQAWSDYVRACRKIQAAEESGKDGMSTSRLPVTSRCPSCTRSQTELLIR